jgi:hypothetical protein
MPSLKEERIRAEFSEQPNGDMGFTFTVIARKSGIEINGHLIGPREHGWTSAAAHFSRRLARLCEYDLKRRALLPDL